MDIFMGVDPSWNFWQVAIMGYIEDKGYIFQAATKEEYPTIEKRPDKDVMFTERLEIINNFVYNKIMDMKNIYGDDLKMACVEKPIYVNNGEAVAKLASAGAVIFSHILQMKIPCHIANNTSWKMKIIGNGNISKSGVAEYMQTMFEIELPKNQWDIYDAMALAMYAGSIYRESIYGA